MLPIIQRREFLAVTLAVCFLFATTCLTAEPITPNRPRTWTDISGQHRIQALLVGMEEGKALLRKSDGRVIPVDLKKLSIADQKWIAENIGAIATNETAPKSHEERTARHFDDLIESEVRRKALGYARRILTNAYNEIGKQDPAWDGVAQQLLEAHAHVIAYRQLPLDRHLPRPPSRAQMRELSEAVRKAGCDDPLVIHIALHHVPRNEWGAPLGQLAQANLEALRLSGYAPIHVAQAGVDTLEPLAASVPPHIQSYIAKGVMEAISATGFQDLDRRFLLWQVEGILDRTIHVRKRVVAEVAGTEGVDPWLRHMLQGGDALRLAEEHRVAYRDPRPGLRPSTPDADAPLKAARKHFVEAWKLHRHHPEPCSKMMMLLCAGGGEEEDTFALWFDRARKEQFDCAEAYKAMRERFGRRGDVEALYAFGVQCLQTGRYDTAVPHNLITCLDICWQLQGDYSILRRPGVHANVQKYFRNIEKMPLDRNMDAVLSLEALLASLADQHEDARKAFEKVGDRLDTILFTSIGQDAEIERSRAFALSGALRVRVAAAEQLALAGQHPEAVRQLKSLIASLGRSDPALRYLRNQEALFQFEDQFGRGEWVSIQPDKYFSGWTTAAGTWSIDEGGALVGTSDPRDQRGGILLCQGFVGSRFEIQGHAEIVAWEGGGRFGAVVAYHSPRDYWECSFFPGETESSPSAAYRVRGDQAFVRCTTHNNKHRRTASVARSDDFRIQVYDGRVATRVGTEITREFAPMIVKLDHSFPSRSTPFGLCVGRADFLRTSAALTADMVEAMRKGLDLAPKPGPPTVVRFTDLRIRKLAQPPTEPRLPAPE